MRGSWYAPGGVLLVVQMQFLVVDDNRDGRFLISRAVKNRYLKSSVREFPDVAALEKALKESLAEARRECVIIAGRTAKHEGAELVRTIRELDPAAPIVAVGHPLESTAAMEAGARAFVNYDAWLMLGPTLERVAGPPSKLTKKSPE